MRASLQRLLAQVAVHQLFDELDAFELAQTSVIADVVSEAVGARRPKTRYAAGKYAKPMIAIRKWFGDRMFDRVIMSQMR